MSLKQRLTWGNSIANTSIALYLSLEISLSIYCSDSLFPSFTTDQPHHSFSSQVTVQQRILSIYPADPICSWFICSLTGVLLLVGLVDVTQSWRVSLGLLPAVAMASDRGCSCGFVSWHTALTLAILALCSYCSLCTVPAWPCWHSPLWGHAVGSHRGEIARPEQSSPLPPDKARGWVTSLRLAYGVVPQIVLLRRLSRWDACRAQREGANHYTGIA